MLLCHGSFLRRVYKVTLAAQVRDCAHVLHTVFKPWDTDTAINSIQHGSLGMTSFVFLMGLLVKVCGFTCWQLGAGLVQVPEATQGPKDRVAGLANEAWLTPHLAAQTSCHCMGPGPGM